MHVSTKNFGIAALLAAGMLVCGIATAAPIVMDLDGMTNATNGEFVQHYYDGGCGGSYAGGPVDCNGPAYGVVWTGLVAGGAPDGLWGNSSNEPSPPNVGGFFIAAGRMDFAAGLDAFSFYYAAPLSAGHIVAFSGVGLTGHQVGNIESFPATGGNCGRASEAFSCWDAFGVSFNETVKSLLFVGDTQNKILFDNFTIGSTTPIVPTTPVPEPAALGMFGLGVLLIGFAGLRRRVLQN